MSALGQKRTSEYVCAMSALPPKADMSYAHHVSGVDVDSGGVSCTRRFDDRQHRGDQDRLSHGQSLATLQAANCSINAIAPAGAQILPS